VLIATTKHHRRIQLLVVNDEDLPGAAPAELAVLGEDGTGRIATEAS